MNKYIKQLVESFFDDMFDEKDEEQNDNQILSNIDTDTEDNTNQSIVNSVYKAYKFTECRNINDIIDTYMDKDKIITWYNDKINDVIQFCKQQISIANTNITPLLYSNKILDNVNRNYTNYNISFTDPLNNTTTIEFHVNSKILGDYSSMHILNMKLSTRLYNVPQFIENNFFVCAFFLKTYQNSKTDEIANIANKDNQDDKFNAYTYKKYVKSIIDKSDIGTNILKENNHKEVVYTISEKDMSRMDKCYKTKKYSGFQAITKLEKLVPRLAAGLRINQNWSSVTYEYNDEWLIKWCNNKFPLENYINSAIKDNVYLKDIIATLNQG